MKQLFKVALTLVFIAAITSADKLPIYKDKSYTVDQRVADLLKRMTLEEKASQLDMLSAREIVIDEKTLSDEKLKYFVDDMPIGSVHDLYPTNAAIANQIQRRAMENSRLGIPLLFIEEGLHGYQGVGSTTFPAPLGSSSAWDTTLMNKIGKVIALEARSHGVHFILGPNLDLAREIRWGRVEETFGEDPYLASRIAVNLIKGMQGDTLSSDRSVVAEPKHFAVHGIPEGGTNSSPVNVGQREALSTHMYAFEKAVTEAKVRGIMAAYHDIDGVPCIANHWLLTDILRQKWGFKGMVVSDLGAVRLQINTHHTAKDPKDAIIKSLNAGLNMQFYDFPYDQFQSSIVEAVNSGELSMEMLDERVREVLKVKFELGLFDNPYITDDLAEQTHHCDAHKELALEASHKSIVMMKNDNNVLPFNEEGIKRITLIGEQGNLSLLGGYSPAQARGITLFEGLRQRFGDDVEIDFIENQVENKFKSIPNSALTPLDGEGYGVNAEYFNNPDVEGKPSYTTIDSEISHYWHNLSPVPGINRDNFSVRWEGYVTAPITGEYEFLVKANDLSRLYLDGKLVVDNWAAPNMSGTTLINLEKGQKVRIKAEYAELDVNAGIDVDWRVTQEFSEEEFFENVANSVRQSDITILALGEIADAVGEGKDRQDLNMSARDIKLLEIVKEVGKPAATVVMNGRPFVMTPIDENSDAVVEAWFPGEFGGRAIVDLLFGDVNPSGKLSISIPASNGQLPAYYSKKRSFKKYYVDGSGLALYPFGHGLSYSTFEYGGIWVSKDSFSKDESITVSFTIKNTSDVKGTEVAQLYINDKVSSVSVPYMSLKGFSRVELEPGEQKEVVIKLTPEHFSLINLDMNRVVEPGEFEILVGSSSRDIREKYTVTVE